MGIVGFLLGAGLSSFGPQYGAGVDQLLEAEVVVADGSLVTVSKGTSQNTTIIKLKQPTT